jgi:hypothetical protein
LAGFGRVDTFMGLGGALLSSLTDAKYRAICASFSSASLAIKIASSSSSSSRVLLGTCELKQEEGGGRGKEGSRHDDLGSFFTGRQLRFLLPVTLLGMDRAVIRGIRLSWTTNKIELNFFSFLHGRQLNSRQRRFS